MQIEIDSNEDFIDNLREELYNEETKKIDTSTEGFNAWIEDIQSGRGVYNSNNVDDTESISNRNDDRLYESHEKATQEELLSKAMEISKLKGKSH